MSLASTFPTVFQWLPHVCLWGQTLPYMTLHNYHCSVNEYVSLTRFREFTPFPMCDTIVSTIQNTALQTRCGSIITAKHGALIIPLFSGATRQQRSSVQRPIAQRSALPAITPIITICQTWLFHLANNRNLTWSTWSSSNTIPMSPSTAIITQWTDNWRSDLTPENGLIKKQGQSQETDYISAQLRLHSFHPSEMLIPELHCTVGGRLWSC